MRLSNAQERAIAEALDNRGMLSSTIPVAPFPVVRSLVRLGLARWIREPRRREDLAAAGWTGRTYVEWVYCAELEEHALDVLVAQ